MKRNGMISLIGIALLALIFLNGCAAQAAEPDMIAAVTETGQPVPEAAVEQPSAEQPVPTQPAAGKLTADEAKAIALNHAGLTEDQVTGLRTEYDVDDGIPEYEVEFRQGKTEYDYEIHAETGEIRSWDKDLDD